MVKVCTLDVGNHFVLDSVPSRIDKKIVIILLSRIRIGGVSVLVLYFTMILGAFGGKRIV